MTEPGIAREDLLRPIPGPDPAGAWLRREGVYEALREAIKEHPADTAFGIEEKLANWPEVVRLAEGALRDRSKDLHLAVSLTQALGKAQEFEGLADGMGVLAELHARFWDGLWPRDLEARVNNLLLLRKGFPNWIRRIPITQGGKPYGLLDSKYAGGASPTGDPWPVSREEFEEGVQATGRDFLNRSALACKAILGQYSRLTGQIRERYGKDAPSIAEVKDSTTEVLDVLERLLNAKGGYLPAPGEEEADRVLAETGASLFERAWLADWSRKGISFEVLRDSVAQAAYDQEKGVGAKEGWPARVASFLERKEPYRAVTPGYGVAPVEPVPAPKPETSGPAVIVPAGDPRKAIFQVAHALRKASRSDPAPYLV